MPSTFNKQRPTALFHSQYEGTLLNTYRHFLKSIILGLLPELYSNTFKIWGKSKLQLPGQFDASPRASLYSF